MKTCEYAYVRLNERENVNEVRGDARACNSYTASELHRTVYNVAVSTCECNFVYQ